MEVLDKIFELLSKMKEMAEGALKVLTKQPSRHYFTAEGTATVTSITERRANLSFLEVQNPNTTPAWIQLFDRRQQAVQLGTTPPSLSILVDPGDGVTPGSTTDHFAYPGIEFTEAISFACTTTVNGSTAPGSDLTVNVTFVPDPELY